MTAIIAVTDGSKVVMGADSAGTRGWDLRTRSAQDTKLIRRSGGYADMLIGASGSARWVSLLRDQFVVPPLEERPLTGQGIPRSYIASVVEAMYRLAKSYDLLDNEKEIHGSMLLACRGVIWHIDSGFALIQHEQPYAAIGCGDQIALGALYVMSQNSDYTFKRMVQEALEAAERFSAGVRGPFVIEEV